MDRNFLRLYNIELQHIRQMAGEFAREYPKIASRLSLDRDGKDTCPDPFVERLIESFAFLAARVQLKLEAEFPRFTQSLLENIFPLYLSPTPSMAVVGFSPNLGDKSLADGFVIPRGTSLPTAPQKEGGTQCIYRTAHTIKLWPLQLTEVEYMDREAHTLGLPRRRDGEAALRFVLQTPPGLPFSALKLDAFDLFLRGNNEMPTQLMEQIIAAGRGLVFRAADTGGAPGGRSEARSWTELPPASVSTRGLAPEDALLPTHATTFDGYRLLMEYFSFWERFRFLRLSHFDHIPLPETHLLEVVIPLGKADPRMMSFVNRSVFELFCTPAINLFPKRMDRIQLGRPLSEYHVMPDRTRPLDFEVHSINKVTGYGKTNSEEQSFMPFYMARDTDITGEAFFTVHRKARLPTEREKKYGRLTSYTGCEMSISIVDSTSAPFRSSLQQLGIEALCTNRHLPLLLTQGDREAAFQVEINGPVQSIRCFAGPTEPKPSLAVGETAWRLISHLTLNHHALGDGLEGQGARSLQEMLMLYVDPHDKSMQKQIQGILSVQTRPITRRLPSPGAISFVRGLEMRLLMDEEQFIGTGIFLLGMVCERFFARFVTINSFSETVLYSRQRGEIYRWPVRTGLGSPL